MNAIKAGTNLSWTGFYLAPAPDRKDASWMATSYAALSLPLDLCALETRGSMARSCVVRIVRTGDYAKLNAMSAAQGRPARWQAKFALAGRAS